MSIMPPGSGGASWTYDLVNFKMTCGDEFFTAVDGTTTRSLPAIVFRYADRDWMLRNTFAPSDHGNSWELPFAIRAGLLWTDCREDDNPTDLELVAMQICNLLSLATGRCVRWVRWLRVRVDESPSAWSAPSVWTAPANEGSCGAIDTHTTGNLRTFLEGAEAPCRAEVDWWNRTLEFHLHAILRPIIDVRLVFLYMLLDRLAAKALGKDPGGHIDSNLDEQLSDRQWQDKLDAVLHEATVKWTRQRTADIVRTVKEWNNSRSFRKKVVVATTRLGLVEPDVGFTNPRHGLLHAGNLPSKSDLPLGIENSGDLCDAVEALVTSMVLRLLNYEGNAWLPGAGRDYDLIYPWPNGRPVPWASRRD